MDGLSAVRLTPGWTGFPLPLPPHVLLFTLRYSISTFSKVLHKVVLCPGPVGWGSCACVGGPVSLKGGFPRGPCWEPLSHPEAGRSERRAPALTGFLQSEAGQGQQLQAGQRARLEWVVSSCLVPGCFRAGETLSECVGGLVCATKARSLPFATSKKGAVSPWSVRILRCQNFTRHRKLIKYD